MGRKRGLDTTRSFGAPTVREGGIPRHDKLPRHDTLFWSPDREGGGNPQRSTPVETCVRRPCMGYGKIQIGSCQYLLAIQTNYTLTYFAEPHREVQPRRRKPLSDRRADQSPVGLGERGGSICNGWSNRQATAIQNRLCAGRVSVCRAPSGCVNLDKEKR
jgi:hypothetical protein